VARFSRDGKFIATGSKDTSIKLVDVEKMKVYNQQKADSADPKYAPARPVIRTFYDHTGAINDLDFHPFQPILCSASQDKTIKFFDYKAQLKRASKSINVSSDCFLSESLVGFR
jgi:cleavage stimulation factor subunit 1